MKKDFSFKTREEVEDYLSGDKIQCLLCGKFFVALGMHIVKMHDMPLRDYKIDFNIPYSCSLIGASFKKRLQEKNKNNPWLPKMIKAGVLKSKIPGRKRAKPTRFEKEQRILNAQKAREARELKIKQVRKLFFCRVCGEKLLRTIYTKNPICKKCENKEQYAKHCR